MNIKLFFMMTVSCFLLLLSGCSSSSRSENTGQAVIEQDGSTSLAAVQTINTEPVLIPTPKPLVSCSDGEVSSYLDELTLLLEEFDDTAEIANSTSRMGLAPVIQDMQSQKRIARRLARPECANYLQDFVIVTMETKIDGFISFLSQESDTIVARKLAVSEEVRSIIDKEIIAFKNDPIAAYEASELTTESLVETANQTEPFALPSGWINISFPDSDELILSIPGDWTQSALGDEGQFLQLKNTDGTLTVIIDVFEDKVYTELDSDHVRLFSLQTSLETEDWDFYSERSAEVGLYALNRGYIVEFLRRYNQSSDIDDNIWAIIATPDENEVFAITSTERDEFAQIDMLTLQEIYASIRTAD